MKMIEERSKEYVDKDFHRIAEEINLIVCNCNWLNYYDYRIVTLDGKGHVRVSFFDDEILISDLYVNESCRNQGIANKLLNKVDELLDGKKATIVPLEDWEAEWYKRRGYIIKSDAE